MTASDAQRYLEDYERAIQAIGHSTRSPGQLRGIYDGPGISVKLSALHARYSRSQKARVLNELLPRLKGLAVQARTFDIGLNIDAEEADRLDLSLDLLEALCFDRNLSGWNGIGFVIQAYQKRCRPLVDWIIDLARRSSHQLMIRLVKGAYWDTEIKRAQVEGLEDFPVFTRKLYTDVSYLACARQLLSAPDAVFPQLATHNAQTVAAIVNMGNGQYTANQYEFQCLHGMGEPLYEKVVKHFARPCRIYAPVGSHETLLAYLVRRLLENGANTSFVNRVADPSVSIKELISDPIALAKAMSPIGEPHAGISSPPQLFAPQRVNSKGVDFSNENDLGFIEVALRREACRVYAVAPLIECATQTNEAPRRVLNPADRREIVGSVIDASLGDVALACASAVASQPFWTSVSLEDRAVLLERAAELLEGRRFELLGLIIREAGKTAPNAFGEIREAVDFLRYYAVQARTLVDPGIKPPRPLGPVVCISPWNFPLAIFIGQVSAALVVGNTVLAKPAEETSIIASAAVSLLHEAGVPTGVLQYVPGGGGNRCSPRREYQYLWRSIHRFNGRCPAHSATARGSAQC